MPVKKSKVVKQSALSVPVYSLGGRSAGKLVLPKEIFGQGVNQKLLAQTLRVYLTNSKGHFGSTKTRSEVTGSTKKIWKQKGTGRARHGGIRAPIFVGGGIAFGPKPRKVVLELPKKMRNKALIQILSQKAKDQEVFGMTGLEKATGKTKEIAKLLTQLNSKLKSQNSKLETTLFVVDQNMNNAKRAMRNLPKVYLTTADQLNTLEVSKYQNLVLTKDSVEKLQQRLSGGKNVK